MDLRDLLCLGLILLSFFRFCVELMGVRVLLSLLRCSCELYCCERPMKSFMLFFSGCRDLYCSVFFVYGLVKFDGCE